MGVFRMTDQERDVQRKLQVLGHAEQTGHVANTCRYFRIDSASFYRWKTGSSGLKLDADCVRTSV